MNLFIVHYDLNGQTAAFFVKALDERHATEIVQSLNRFKEEASVVSIQKVDMSTFGIIG